MNSHHALVVGVVALATVRAGAQKPPAPRQLGAIIRTSTNPLASAATAVAMPDGQVLVNDIAARRLLLFDSTLTKTIIVADTTGATANAYGARAGTLIAYRGDSALYIDIGSLSMLVIGPSGKIARIMAVPRPDEAQSLIGSVFGMPAFDAAGRLVSYGRVGGGEGTLMLCCVGFIKTTDLPRRPDSRPTDSAFVVRSDLATRSVDTVAAVKIPRIRNTVKADEQNYVQGIETTYYPLPVVDDWAVTSDGTIAIVRGTDYHVDWLRRDGKWESSPKLPFDWQRLDDARKTAIIDSSVASHEEANRAEAARSASGAEAGGGRGAGGGRAGGGAAGGRARPREIPNLVGRPQLGDLPDYVPPFLRGAVRADAEGNLWIRTSTVVSGQPVYDIVNRRGELADRVQLPPFRTIAGFAPGFVYMAVKDGTGVVHLERARVK